MCTYLAFEGAMGLPLTLDQSDETPQPSGEGNEMKGALSGGNEMRDTSTELVIGTKVNLFYSYFWLN